ncbi:hypothetical protein YDYSY3_48160 [Paenibacillus chitinolyticus]|nr:hypothetical protein YDYSY3_48160 [Paenibacillus chitinolyticus]
MRGRDESYHEQEDRSQTGTGKKKADGRNGRRSFIGTAGKTEGQAKEGVRDGRREKKESESCFPEEDRRQEEKRESRQEERAKEKTPPVRFRETQNRGR